MTEVIGFGLLFSVCLVVLWVFFLSSSKKRPVAGETRFPVQSIMNSIISSLIKKSIISDPLLASSDKCIQ